MKTAVAANGNTLQSELSPFFARCPYFMIVEVQEDKIQNSTPVSNPALRQRGGAGLSAAQLVGNQGAEKIISLSVGPRAMDVLQQLRIKIYQGVQGTVKQNIEKLIKGELEELTTPGPMGLGPGKGLGMRHGGLGRGGRWTR